MSLLPRFALNRHRAQEKALEQQVTALRSALDQCKGMAKRWTEVRLEVMAIIAVVFMGLGFALGVYREPLQHSVGDLLARMGIGSSQASFETVNAVFQKGDYPAALKLAQPLADDGDARAESIVAQIHYRGRGVPQSDTEAAKWFRRAADQGDAVAQFYLGVMYNEGRGVPQDYAEAAKWYKLAAEQGDALAQYNLGLSYARGEGVTPDPVTAHMWLNLASARFPAGDSRNRTAATQEPRHRRERDELGPAHRGAAPRARVEAEDPAGVVLAKCKVGEATATLNACRWARRKRLPQTRCAPPPPCGHVREHPRHSERRAQRRAPNV